MLGDVRAGPVWAGAEYCGGAGAGGGGAFICDGSGADVVGGVRSGRAGLASVGATASPVWDKFSADDSVEVSIVSRVPSSAQNGGASFGYVRLQVGQVFIFLSLCERVLFLQLRLFGFIVRHMFYVERTAVSAPAPPSPSLLTKAGKARAFLCHLAAAVKFPAAA